MNTQPGDDDGVTGIVYVLHLEPAYRHAPHHIGWTAGDVGEHKTTQFCPTRRTRRGGPH